MQNLRQLLEYNAWANRRALESLKSDPSSDQARRILAHIVAAERLWLYRMEGKETSDISLWPEWTLEECAKILEENQRLYTAFMEGLAFSGFNRVVTYRNTAGKAFQNTVGDILWHVFLHGAYHRGEIARAVREAGHEPLSTDYIVYVREGFQKTK